MGEPLSVAHGVERGIAAPDDGARPIENLDDRGVESSLAVLGHGVVDLERSIETRGCGVRVSDYFFRCWSDVEPSGMARRRRSVCDNRFGQNEMTDNLPEDFEFLDAGCNGNDLHWFDRWIRCGVVHVVDGLDGIVRPWIELAEVDFDHVCGVAHHRGRFRSIGCGRFAGRGSRRQVPIQAGDDPALVRRVGGIGVEKEPGLESFGERSKKPATLFRRFPPSAAPEHLLGIA